jgi:hypothetical protein
MSVERELLKKILMLYKEDKFCILWEAVNEIEKLLAQPEQTEQEPVAWIDDGSLKSLQESTGYALRFLTNDTENLKNTDVPLYLAPPKREPVAWKETLIERFQSAFDSEMFQTDEGEALILLEDAICYIEEFAPPKRKPLSNEDIANLEIQSKTLDTLDYRYGFIEGFLCAEKAHDITGVDDE